MEPVYSAVDSVLRWGAEHTVNVNAISLEDIQQQTIPFGSGLSWVAVSIR